MLDDDGEHGEAPKRFEVIDVHRSAVVEDEWDPNAPAVDAEALPFLVNLNRFSGFADALCGTENAPVPATHGPGFCFFPRPTVGWFGWASGNPPLRHFLLESYWLWRLFSARYPLQP